jgi:hypothetical protein
MARFQLSGADQSHMRQSSRLKIAVQLLTACWAQSPSYHFHPSCPRSDRACSVEEEQRERERERERARENGKSCPPTIFTRCVHHLQGALPVAPTRLAQNRAACAGAAGAKWPRSLWRLGPTCPRGERACSVEEEQRKRAREGERDRDRERESLRQREREGAREPQAQGLRVGTPARHFHQSPTRTPGPALLNGHSE